MPKPTRLITRKEAKEQGILDKVITEEEFLAFACKTSEDREAYWRAVGIDNGGQNNKLKPYKPLDYLH